MDKEDITPADQIVNERRAVYGDPTESFTNVAHVWTGILGFEVQPWQVPLMMVGLKLVRTSQCPTYSDNSDDVNGYMDIFREVMGDDMVHARTVDQYVAERQRRGSGLTN